jgi:hypothetical protein
MKNLEVECKSWFYVLKCVINTSLHTFTSFRLFINFDGKQNVRTHSQSSQFTQIRTNAHSNTLSLVLQSTIAQMRIKGSKMRVYIDIIGEGKLKGHQINGSLPLGNIIVHLPLPQLIPYFSTLPWPMDNFGWPYRIELTLGTYSIEIH